MDDQIRKNYAIRNLLMENKTVGNQILTTLREQRDGGDISDDTLRTKVRDYVRDTCRELCEKEVIDTFLDELKTSIAGE